MDIHERRKQIEAENAEPKAAIKAASELIAKLQKHSGNSSKLRIMLGYGMPCHTLAAP